MIRFSKVIWAKWKKNLAKNQWTFTSTEKNLKVISALNDFNNRNKIIKEGSRIPNIINEHFATVGNKLANNLPIPQKHHLDFVNKCKSPISSFFFQPVLPEELLSEILLVPNDKSYGLYSSPTKLLKYSSAVTAPVLSEILNISIRLGTYPLKLKIAKNYASEWRWYWRKQQQTYLFTIKF